MIDFRYHVVSIVAIFLALTVGLVIGASILSKGVADSLKASLTERNNQIKSQSVEAKLAGNLRPSRGPRQKRF